MSWRVYQSVLSSDVFATTTSLRTPSTSCAYQSGKVSLSPTTTSTPYGSTEFNRSRAKSPVSVCPLRDAVLQFVKSGIAATSRIGAPFNHDRFVGSSTSCVPSFTSSVPNIEEMDSHRYTRPRPAHTPHAEKLQR